MLPVSNVNWTPVKILAILIKHRLLHPICGKDVYWGNKCCSKNCAARLARNVHWPQDEAFLEIYTNNSRRQAAKMLNVSIAGLQKHFKRIKRATPDLHGEPTG